MFHSLWFKLVGALAAVVAVALIVVGVGASFAASQQFGLYAARGGRAWAAQIAPALSDVYLQDGDWHRAQEVLDDPLHRGALQPRPDRGPMMGPGGEHMPGMMRGEDLWEVMSMNLLLADQRGAIVADTQDTMRGHNLPPEMIDQGTPVIANGERVGTLVVIPIGSLEVFRPANSFLLATGRSVLLAALAAGFVGIVLGTILFSRITRPLKELEQAARTVEAGQLAARVPVTSRDELGRVADAFNQMTSRLETQQRLRKQMVADVAHELRTPLSVMQGTIEAMLDGVLKPNKNELRNLHDQIRRLTRLVEDLRTLSLAEEGQLRLEMVEVDPAALVEQAVRAMQPIAEERHVTVAAEPHRPIPIILADGDRLAEALTNLIDNALRYVPEGGHVTVQANPSENGILLVVSDDGPGISPEDLNYVFERFWRGDKSRSRTSGGSGIGLAIVKQIIELHKGAITVESEIGKGAAFRITLPASPAQAPTLLGAE